MLQNLFKIDFSFYLCFRLLVGRGGSLKGSLKISRKIGSNFLKITVDTLKLLSNLSTLSRISFGRLAISAHFFILLKNCTKLKSKKKRKLRKRKQYYTKKPANISTIHKETQHRNAISQNTFKLTICQMQLQQEEQHLNTDKIKNHDTKAKFFLSCFINSDTYH